MFSQGKKRNSQSIDGPATNLADRSDACSSPNSYAKRCRQSVSNLIMPPHCMDCRSVLPPDRDLQLCPGCQEKIIDEDRLPVKCHGCSARLRFEIPDEGRCHFCRDLNLPFASVTSLGNYQGALREHIVRMKSRNGQDTAIQFGMWLAEATIGSLSTFGFRPDSIDWIVPMPAHWMRRIGRGHNVSSLLAESFARYDCFRSRVQHCLQLTRRTRKQGTLTMNQRFENVRGSLAIRGNGQRLRQHRGDASLPVAPNILLIDDVMTSGATAIHAAKVLRKAGAELIHLAVVARAVGQNR